MPPPSDRRAASPTRGWQPAPRRATGTPRGKRRGTGCGQWDGSATRDMYLLTSFLPGRRLMSVETASIGAIFRRRRCGWHRSHSSEGEIGGPHGSQNLHGRRHPFSTAACITSRGGLSRAQGPGPSTTGRQRNPDSRLRDVLRHLDAAGPGAASANSARTRARIRALRRHDSRMRRLFAHHASNPARSNSANATLQPPAPAGFPVVNSPGAATGFNGLSHADQRTAGTGIYVNTQFSLEPPDQGLCVGNGFVVEPINTAFAVYDTHGNAVSGVNALSQFYLRSPLVNRTTGVTGDFISDPKCYFDPVGKRFIQTVLEVDAPGNFNGRPPINRTHVLIAVSQTGDPTGTWNLFSFDTSDDGLNGTQAHTGCPCLPDQPLLGANRDGVFISVNEFQDNPNFFFNGAQIFALGRSAVESGASSVRFAHLDVGPVPTGDANLPFWGSLQPSTSIDPGRGTELLMTGGPEDIFQNNATLDNRIAAWSLTGTRSLGSASPSLELRHTVLTSETYGLPIGTGATQKSGPTPLRDSLGDVDPLETINANDSRMNQVVDVNGVLYGGVNTTVTSAAGPPRVGIAYFTVGAIGTPGHLFAHILRQGYVAVDGANVLFPSIPVNRSGRGAMS